MTTTHQQMFWPVIGRRRQIVLVLPPGQSKAIRAAADSSRLLSLFASWFALAACGGGGAEAPPTLTVSDTGAVTVERASVFLAAAQEGIALTLFKLNNGSAVGDVADVSVEAAEEMLVKSLMSVSVEDGHFVVAALDDFSKGGFAAGVTIQGNLWLQSGLDVAVMSEAVTLVVALEGYDLIFDMPSDAHSVTLETGSRIDLGGGRIIVSDGTLDLEAAELVGVTDIVLNSTLIISVQQLAELDGTVQSGGSGTLQIALVDQDEAELLFQILAGKALPAGLELALEAKTLQVAAYLEEVLLPEIAGTLGFKAVGVVAGENDAPLGIEVAVNDLPENARDLVAATFSVIDLDLGDTHNITMSDDRFVAIGNEIVLADGVSLDFEGESVIELTITATDADGLSVERLIELHVVDVNEVPTELFVNSFLIQEEIGGQTVAEVAVVDPDASDTHVISVSDDRFTVLGNQIVLAEGITIDFETESSVTLLITATDSGGLSISQATTLNIIDTNDAPSAILVKTYEAFENEPGVLVADVFVEDPDLGDSHVITVSDARFVVTDNQIFLAEGASLDFETDSVVPLMITATDRDGLSLRETVLLQVVDVNEAPTSIVLDNLRVSENAPGALVAALSVIDPDQGDTHVITLLDESRFVFDGNDIRLKPGVALDHETTPKISFTITATDQGGLSLSRTVNLQVLDVNEAPTALSLANTVTTAFENQMLSTRLVVADLVVTDDALGSNTFSLSGADAAFFEVRSGRLYLKAGVLPEYIDNPRLDVTITVSDPTLPGNPSLFTQMTINLRETNTSLASVATDAVGFLDADASNSYTAGDTITLRFNSAVNVAGFTTSDFAVSSGGLGNATLTALNAVNGQASDFSLTLGSTSVLTAQSGLSVRQYAITDTEGLANANVISFALPQLSTGFDITLNYSGDSHYLSIFEAAAAVWERVIVADLPDVGGIDDVLIDVEVKYIDGRSGILGYAGFTDLRAPSDGGLPYAGLMVFEAVDLDTLSSSEAIDVAIHEIAHVLGFGTLWDDAGLISRNQAAYYGDSALAAYQSAGGGGNFIPLETDGGSGTAYYHWDEDILGREIMTGYLDSGENYLSAITIGAMEDLGYVVDYSVAEPYMLVASVLV